MNITTDLPVPIDDVDGHMPRIGVRSTDHAPSPAGVREELAGSDDVEGHMPRIGNRSAEEAATPVGAQADPAGSDDVEGT